MIEFLDDDAGFTAWLDANPSGFVVNRYRNATPTYLKLHRATCSSLRRPNPTSTDYGKVCAPDVAEFQAYAAQVGGPLTACGRCHPDAGA